MTKNVKEHIERIFATPDWSDAGQGGQGQAGEIKLSGRERKILERLVAGKPNKAIANELGISVRTVESHRAAVMKKMGVASLAELVRSASGLIAETTERHR